MLGKLNVFTKNVTCAMAILVAFSMAENAGAVKGGCPFRRHLSPAEKMHSSTLGTFDDSLDRELFEAVHRRQRRDERGFLYGVRTYLRNCVKPVLLCSGKYRSFNGVCNNEKHVHWGSANSCLLRLLPPQYSDGVSSPVGLDGSLPSASQVSVQLEHIRETTGETLAKPSTTHLFFALGQFLDHDIANSVVSSISSTENPDSDCCLNPKLPQCSMALDVSSNPFYARHNVTCINFVRSARCPCSSGRQRQQMNGATAYIDLSQVYGNSAIESVSLRSPRWKFLLESYDNGVLLPLGESHCVSEKCFRGADNRINQQAALTSLHTIFMRYHNHLATILWELNPRWSHDKVFEEARRINIAQFQVVVMREFLPLLLGEDRLQQWGISFRQLLLGSEYVESAETGMFNEFLAAAFRLHTIIPEELSAKLKFDFFNTDNFFRQGTDYTTGVVKSLIASQGRAATFPVSNVTARHVYDTDGDFGLDLVAINVQRGRDHGLRSYTDYLKLFWKSRIEKFEDLLGLMDAQAVDVLRKIYKKVNDIDLYVGGYLETATSGLVGPTMSEIILKQFELLVKADRFFVTHRGGFTKPQFEELVRTSLAGLFCATTNIDRISRWPLKHTSDEVSCEEIHQPNLKLWSPV